MTQPIEPQPQSLETPCEKQDQPQLNHPAPQQQTPPTTEEQRLRQLIGATATPRIQIRPREKALGLTPACRVLRYSLVLETKEGLQEINVEGAATLNNLIAPSSLPEALLVFNTALKNLVVEPTQREFAFMLNKYKKQDTMKHISEEGIVFHQEALERDDGLLYPDGIE
jgi:hypothetical protein